MRRVPLFLCAVLLAAPATAATYHVAPGGSDSDSGSAAAPWATLQHAADEVGAGDIVLVHDGTYRGFQIETSGTPTSPIVFRAQGTGAVINEENPVRGQHDINVEGASYVVIEGFRVRDADVAGIRVVEARGVVVRGNVVGPNGRWGIFTGFAPEVQLIGNETFGSGLEHGIYVSNSDGPDDNPVVRGNTSYGNGRNGIQLNGDCYAGGDGTLDGGVIENNVVHDNTNKGLSIISAPGVRIQNNVIYNNGLSGAAGGIHLVDEPDCGQPTDDAIVVNNTIVEPRIAGIRMNDGASGNVVFNNLIVSGNPIADEEGLNHVDAASNVTRMATTGLFVDAAAHDYRLAAGSAALKAGTAAYQGAAAPAVDAVGAPRPSGPAFDAGAYEGVGVASTEDTPAATAPVLYPVAPNPAASSAEIRYTLPRAGHALVQVFDSLGREVLRLVDATQPPGTYTVPLGADVPSGTYLVRLSTTAGSQTRPFVRR